MCCDVVLCCDMLSCVVLLCCVVCHFLFSFCREGLAWSSRGELGAHLQRLTILTIPSSR